MPHKTDTLRAAEYFIAVQGLAMMRYLITDTSLARKRMDDVRHIIDRLDEFPQSLEFPVTEYEVEAGYALWAQNYDGPNPAIEMEEPVVQSLLAGIAPGIALDAACGTGRHAASLAALGHTVIGVDTTEAMLAIARTKVSEGDFRRGRLESLPLDDASVDLVTCALALTHVERLAPVIQEFARVVRKGGRAILSDMHPLMAMTSGMATFPAADGAPGVTFVRNRTHQLSAYVQTFLDAGFRITACLEPTVTEETLSVFPSHRAYPDATREAFLGMPYLLVWQLERE